LKDVAREAGVAAMTVSVVLNGARSGTRVSDATRIRIEEAAKRLHYRPNAIGRGLSRRRMDTIGVVATIDGPLNLYFLEVLNGILAECVSHGQNTTVFSVSDWRLEEEKILHFCDGRVDGIIFLGPNLTPEFSEMLSRRTSFVTIHGGLMMPGIHNLEVDDEDGAHQIVTHMIELGHRRIAHFTGQLDQPGASRRLAGYQRSLMDAGLPVDEDLILPGYFTDESGRERMTALLDRGGPLPTAIFCANDGVAYGALDVLAARGLQAPRDISIAGFDDLMLAKMTTPHLTTMRQPFRDMAARAVQLLLHQVGDGSDNQSPPLEPTASDIFPVKLIVRESVGPPPQ
ncbi:MAG: LacI family DNA-binding transcriptional regulator, partial [Capsulimonas sp.]|uniref:LacI family DNA-binding transcriptional regulator n=1 Tax=Capsulimonas sp. TaxID=2494211 RepID=UPI003267450A